jgi:hypothetical protein
LQKFTTTEVINAEEEDDHPRPVAAASLVDRAGEEQPAMSLNQKGWMSSKWGKLGDLDLAVRALYVVAKFETR